MCLKASSSTVTFDSFTVLYVEAGMGLRRTEALPPLERI